MPNLIYYKQKQYQTTYKGETKMLDYEIKGYEVYYFRKNGCSYASVKFDTEEEAVNFIKEERHKWTEYRLEKIQIAVIDF